VIPNVHQGGCREHRTVRWRSLRRAAAGAVTVIALGGVLAACGSSKPAAKTSTAKQPTVHLDFFMWSSTKVSRDAWRKLTSMVSTIYPNIHVTFVTVPYSGFYTKLASESATGTAPCIAASQSQKLGTTHRYFIALNKYIKSGLINLSGFNHAEALSGRVNGNYYILNYDTGGEFVWYNRELFKEAHVPYPKAGWTWNDFIKDSREIVSRLAGKHVFAITLHPGASLNWMPMIDGAKFYKNGHLDLVGNTKLADAITWEDNLYSKYHVAPPPGVPQYSGYHFADGNLAMQINGPWGLSSYYPVSKFPIGTVVMPTGPGGFQYASGSGFGVTRSCKYPKEAVEALKVITSVKADKVLANVGRAWPAQTAADKYYEAYAKKTGITDLGKTAAAATAQMKPFYPPPVTFLPLARAMSTYMPEAALGKISVTAMLKKVNAEVKAGS
jgi:multiple sugar transport system substrate-binding protein